MQPAIRFRVIEWLQRPSRTIDFALILSVVALLTSACATTNEVVQMEEQSDFHLHLAYGHWEVGDAPNAIEELEMALAISPVNADAHYMLGFVFSGRQMHADAIRHYRQALLLNPDWEEVKNNLGVVFLALERWEEAEAIFQELSEIPSYETPGHAYNNLGWAQLNQGRTREALSNLEMATYLQPSHCLAYNNQGIALAILEREREAEERFEEAVSRCDNYAEPRFHLARLRQAQGLYAEAQVLFEECVELLPSAALGRRCREFIEQP